MRPVRKAADDPRFLLKALGEASGELRRSIEGLPLGMLLEVASGADDGWCLMSIAVHMRNVERGTMSQVEGILSRPGDRIKAVDLDDIPLLEEYDDEDEEEVFAEFSYLRRQLTYRLWEAMEPEWRQSGHHPYRGDVTLVQLIRELYQHDLQHLWQAHRMINALRPARQ
jgi:hypothetical protein